MLTIGSLFSGIGGLELGLERAGLGPVTWQCEIDPWCRSVLAYYWPSADRFNDVHEISAPRPVDLICGGFPCTDISVAGRREGIHGKDSALWFEMLRVIRVVRPRFVVLENVSALLVRGMGAVLGGLSESGYDAIWDCVPAQAVGAPHRRDRLFVVAWRVPDAELDGVWDKPERGEGAAQPPHGRNPFAVALGETVVRKQRMFPPRSDNERSLRSLPTDAQPAVCKLAHGFSSGLLRDRRKRLKALGNAVVPAVGEVVGRVVLQLAGEG